MTGLVHSRPGFSAGGQTAWWIAIAFLGLWSAAVTPPPAAWAQGRATDTVLFELERTDRVIATAAEAVGTAANAYSHQQLNSARKLQGLARSEYAQRHLKLALRYTIDARQHALKAIDAARIEERAGEDVRRAVDEAQERIAEAAEKIQRSGNPLALRILDQSIDQIQRARRALAAGNLTQAARLAGLAVSLIARASRMADEQITAGEAAAASIDRTESLLAEAEAVLAACGSPESSRSALHEARRYLSQARDRVQRGQYATGLRLSLRARKAGIDLLAQLRASPRAEDLIAMLDELTELLAETSAEIFASGNPEAIRRLSQAEELLGQARELIQRGKPEEALRALVAAESVLREAADAAGP